ncbi:MAG TPA: hypothetical protein VIX73_25495 [Kofleriaceae bacterium]|jgi:hypothetical protein
MSLDHRSQHAHAGAHAATAAAHATPGKRTLTESLGESAGPTAAASRTVEGGASGAKADKWTTLFDGKPSRVIEKLARVAVPNGLRVRARPGRPSDLIIPFNTLVQLERTTNEDDVAHRWAYVVAPNAGAAGFVEERFLMWDPPEASAKLHEVQRGETLGRIVEHAYQGHVGHGHDERMYCQAVYLANRHVAGVQLDPVKLSILDTFDRGKDEQETLRIYKGVKVIANQAIWLPSNDFIAELKRKAKVTSGQTQVTEAWDAAKDAVAHVIEHAEYIAGVISGLLDGVVLAFNDLFANAVQMATAVLRVLTADAVGLYNMAKKWLGGFAQLWEHRGQVADDFFAKWNAKNDFARGKFQGEVIGWLITNVVLVLLTGGEAAEGVLASIATRFPEAVKALRVVSDLGEVTTYTKAAGKHLELPEDAKKFLDKKIPADVQIANNAKGHARFRNEWDSAHKIGSIAATGHHGGAKRYRFTIASTNELESLADVLGSTEAWVLHETVRLSPRGVQAVKRALQDHPHHSLQALFSGHHAHARAAVDHDTLVVII